MIDKIKNSENFEEFFQELNDEKQKEIFCKCYYEFLKSLSEKNLNYMTKTAIIIEIISSLAKMFYFPTDSKQIKDIELSEEIASFLKLEPRQIDGYIRKLKYQTLSSEKEIEEYVGKNLFHNAAYEILQDKRKIRYFVSDDYTREQIERFLKKNNQIYDFSFNRSILEFGEESLKLVLQKFLCKEDAEEMLGKVQKDIRKLDRLELANNILSFIFDKDFEPALRVGQSFINMLKRSFEKSKDVSKN
ncbi:MAG: hypothetical protein N2Z58_09320 [Fervidobacterium sp.]|nr:hypothetical protein [Fervidobacterium sp.]